MPLSQPRAQALPGNSSSSRKRTHAEITRSESRSQSPQPPSKRRRTFPSASQNRISSSPDSTAYSSDGVRFVGDGVDHRRPIMSTAPTSQQQNQETIDLTLDDDTPPPHAPPAFYVQHPGLTNNARATQFQPRASPYDTEDEIQDQDVIDLSSDEEDAVTQATGGTRLAPSSPEVQFIRERTLPRPPDTNQNQAGRPHLPMLPAMGGQGAFSGMANMIRDVTSGLFGHARNFPTLPYGPAAAMFNRATVIEEEDPYANIQMNYAGAAFQVGNNVLLLEDPTTHNNTVNRNNDPVYKAPPPVPNGFTRNYEEDDMLICGHCKDELATGKTEQKQQVWIIKQCGHAYCGDCAHGRAITKQRNNRDTKKIASKRTNEFKACAIPGCKKPVNSKTKMFQIYL